MKKIHLLIITCCVSTLFLCTPATGCINRYSPNIDGTLKFGDEDYYDALFSNIYRRRDVDENLIPLVIAQNKWDSTHTTEDLSDYAVQLLYNRRYDTAKKIWQHIEATEPGRYAIAANLGTVYELLGQNDSALYWIKRAMTIDPNSHFGSEWIHVRVLQAKIAARGNNKYYAQHNILGLDFGAEEVPVYKGNIPDTTLYRQLFYQLNERTWFIKPKDAAVGQLLFDYANLVALKNNIGSAEELYKLAEKYGYNSPVLDKRIKFMQQLQARADRWTYVNDHKVPLVLACIILTIGLVIFLFWTRKKRLAQTPDK